MSYRGTIGLLAPGVMVRDLTRRPEHIGEVLSPSSPEAWAHTLAFYGVPTQAEVDDHLAWLRERGIGLDGDKLPVKWNFGKLYWERVENLVPVEEVQDAIKAS